MLAASWQHLPPGTVQQFLQRCDGWLLLMYGQPACGACRGWYRCVPQWLPTGWSLAYVDVVADAAQAARHEIFHLPAFMLYRDGEFHAQLEAPMAQHAWLENLQAACAAPAQEEP